MLLGTRLGCAGGAVVRRGVDRGKFSHARAQRRQRTFMSPVVFHFSTLLIISLIAMVPSHTALSLAIGITLDVYVRNMEHFDRIHKVRREYFKPPAPASTMVEVCKMTSPDYLIEMSAIAVVGN
jgi:hypothetical protein